MNTIIAISLCGLQLASFAVLITFWFKAMRAFDNLVKYQYENLHEQWVSDGEPRGMFWKPPQSSKNMLNLLVKSNSGFTVLKWVFYTPPWVKNDSKAMDLLKRGRKFTLYWNIGVPLWFAIMLGLTALSSTFFGK